MRIFDLRYTIYIELGETEGKIERVYIRTPAPLASLGADKWRDAQRIGEIFRFAEVVTGTQGIRPYVMESGLTLIQILRRVVSEREGLEKMTSATIPEGLRAWLHRKGFVNDKDVEELEKAAGSMAEALLMLIHILPRQRFNMTVPFSEPGDPNRQSGRDRNRWQSFDRDKYNSVGRLYEEIDPYKSGQNAYQSDSHCDKAIPQEAIPQAAAVLTTVSLASQTFPLENSHL